MKRLIGYILGAVLIAAFIAVFASVTGTVHTKTSVADSVPYPRLYYLFNPSGPAAYNNSLNPLGQPCPSDFLKNMANFNAIEIKAYWADSRAVFPCDGLGGNFLHWLRTNGVSNKKLFMFHPGVYMNSISSDDYLGSTVNDINNSDLWLYADTGSVIQHGSTYFVNGSDITAGPNPNSGYRLIAATEVAQTWSQFDGVRFDQIPYSYHQVLAGSGPDFNRDSIEDLCHSPLNLRDPGLNSTYFRAVSAWMDTLSASKPVGANGMWEYQSLPLYGLNFTGIYALPYATHANLAMNEDFTERGFFWEQDSPTPCNSHYDNLNFQQRWAMSVRAESDWLTQAKSPSAYIALGTDLYDADVDRFSRLFLSSCLLNNGYCAWSPGESYGSADNWMPEFAVDISNGVTDVKPAKPAHTGWLGNATGPARDSNGRSLSDWISSQNADHTQDFGQMGTVGWLREFDNGVALSNPSEAAITFALPGTFKRLTTAGSTVNTGGSGVTSISVPSHDGLLMLRIGTPPATSTPSGTPPTATKTPTPNGTPATATSTRVPTSTPTPTSSVIGNNQLFSPDAYGYIASDPLYSSQNLASTRGYMALDDTGNQYSLMRFNNIVIGTNYQTGNIFPNAVIDSAVLTVHAFQRYGGIITAQSGQVTKVWDNTVSWNYLSPVSSNVQFNGGIQSLDAVNTAGVAYTFDVKNIVQNWSNGQANDGIILAGIGGTGTSYLFNLDATLGIVWHQGSVTGATATRTPAPLPSSTPSLSIIQAAPAGFGTNPVNATVLCQVVNSSGRDLVGASVDFIFDTRYTINVVANGGSTLPGTNTVEWSSQVLANGSTTNYLVSLTANIVGDYTTTNFCRVLADGWFQQSTASYNTHVDAPTATATVVGTATSTSTRIPPNTSTNTPTNLPTKTATSTPSSTSTLTPSITPSATPSNTTTPTPSDTPTPVGTTPVPVPGTFTNTPSPTNTQTPTSTSTNTPTNTATPTRTSTNTATFTPTPTFTLTPSNTPTVTSTPTKTQTPLPTSTKTPTPTNPPTVTRTPTPVITSTPQPYLLINEIGNLSRDVSFNGSVGSYVELYNGFPQDNHGLYLCWFRIRPSGGTEFITDNFMPGAYVNTHGWLALRSGDISGLVIPTEGGSINLECYDVSGNWHLVDNATIRSAADLNGQSWGRVYDGSAVWSVQSPSYAYSNTR